MAARHDILDAPESLRKPLAASLGLHALLALSVALSGLLPEARRIPWGDPNSLGGGAVAITPVSKIPLPSRAGRTNPVAEDTESQVPAPRAAAPPKSPAKPEEPDAIPLKGRQAPRRPPARGGTRRTPAESPPHQLYSAAGAAVNSPMFGSTSAGAGGLGLGEGNPFGDRFGAYAAILRQMVAAKWNTSQVDPRLQTAPPVIVTFEILRDGSVRNVRLLQRSGNATLDYSAQRAILEAAPFPPLPRGFERDVAVVEFWFQLKR
jgi:protein TonB